MRRLWIGALSVFLIAAGATAQSITLRVKYDRTSQFVSIYWNYYSGAASYRVSRTNNPPAYELVSTGPTNGSGAAQQAGSTWAYQVEALDSSGNAIPGAVSNLALVSAVDYTDATLSTTTVVRAQHVNELRAAVNAARAALGGGNLAQITWANPISAGSPIRATDIADLRGGLDQALARVAGGAVLPWDDPVLGSTTAVRKRHIEQLRLRLRMFPEYVSTSLAVSNAFFSPNGDGQKDTTTVSGTMAPNASPIWLINVRNSSGTIVRSVIGAGTAVSYAWDGRDGNNVVQPEGTYTFELVDGDGISVPVATASTTIDLTPPAVAIAAPAAGQVLSNVRQNATGDIAVTGTATDAHFATWTLGVTAPSVSTLGSGVAQMSAATLLGTLRTLPLSGPLPNGTYSLRLSATDQAGNLGVSNVDIVVGNFTVSQDVNQLNAAAGEHVTYTSIVPFPLTETVTIRAGGAVVKTLVNQQRAGGTYADVWDGSNDSAALTGDGSYTYTATATEGSGTLTWTQAGQFLGSTITQFPYPQCRDAGGALVACQYVPFDPFTNQPLRIVYCVSDTGGNCPGGGPMMVSVKSAYATETTPNCDSYCFFSDAQAGAQQELVWYGLPSVLLASPPNRLVVIRRNDTFPRNMTVVYGTAPVISNLALSTLMTGPGGPITLTFNAATFQSRQARVTAIVRNAASGIALRTIVTGLAPAGARSIVWDARADNQLWVAPGTYEIALTVTDSSGGSATIKPLVMVRF